MKAERCYQSEVENTTLIRLFTPSEFGEYVNELSKADQNKLDTQQFKGNLGETAYLTSQDGIMSQAFMGLGDSTDVEAINQGVSQLPPGDYRVNRSLSQPAMVAWALAQYGYDCYKRRTGMAKKLTIPKERLSDVLMEANAVYLVRDLINTPACDLGPEKLAAVLESIAHNHCGKFKQWVGKELLDENYPAIHAVGRAAAEEPRLLSLTWGDTAHPKVTLIGKGVCFDTGGLDIKPSNAMRLMKKDMGGAAQVIGLAQWIMIKALPICLQVLIPAVENSIGRNAFRPGDILTMRNGLTVEVDNTDAEGRLVLADALTRACEEKPELLIDFATLTGAARVAVGTELSAMFTNRDVLASQMTEASLKACDPVWRMPLHEGYQSLLDSSIADLSNCSATPYAGAITAALFLQRFIDKSISWVHFDIMAWNVGSKPGKPEGGEAMAMQAVAYYLLNKYKA